MSGEGMSAVVRIYRHGGPEVLTLEEEDAGAPGPGQVKLRQTAIGLNFIDVYHRTGLLHQLEMPAVLGVQGAGVVIAVGSGVTDLREGDRVTYSNVNGAYRAERVVPADRMVKLPADIPEDLAAAAFLRGLTAEYLLRRLYKVSPGETILVHAAAGGAGQIIVQWAKALGATVIGTVGTDAKADLVRELGCDHAIVYTREDFPERVLEITGGTGVPVVYDSVGKDTFTGSLACLAPMGHAINFGTASGSVEPFPLQDLHAKSLTVTRPTLVTYIAAREDLLKAADAVFQVLRDGIVKVPIAARYPLAEVAAAQTDLEGRRTTGAMILEP